MLVLYAAVTVLVVIYLRLTGTQLYWVEVVIFLPAEVTVLNVAVT